MKDLAVNRRTLIRGAACGAGGLMLNPNLQANDLKPKKDYKGPNVIIIRFGGGVRRQETINRPSKSYCPYFLKELCPKGTFYPNMEISQFVDMIIVPHVFKRFQEMHMCNLCHALLAMIFLATR